MALFKCKMCGGALEVTTGETVAVCEYCGTKQTLPKLDDEKKANLYDRANHFRRGNDFDKAAAIYEQILDADTEDAEAYWSLVLCRYGIEYVEDPASHKRIPTVNRAQFTSIFADEDYKSAIKYADGYQKEIYEQEAKTIDGIQKEILLISQKEEPFDVFICYKETDANGRRTQDSVLANDLYHQLTQEGFKVFFSRITLEDKLGTAYEPYIFAALNSAKVMVVLGTKAEYFNAVWVKNEWSRYLALIKNGAKKTLIPAYRDMDPYDLPDEFSHLQAQDMSKLGFMQDLIRGIKKIVNADVQQTNVIKETVISSGSTNVAPLLRRAFMFLEDGDWNSANDYCEKVLDIEPENAEAYLGKLLSGQKVRKIENLQDLSDTFDDNGIYEKIMRFGSEELKAQLESYNKIISDRKEAELEDEYMRAKKIMQEATGKDDFGTAADMFENLWNYKDSEELRKICVERFNAAVECEKNYLSGVKLLEQGTENNSIANINDALGYFVRVRGFKDAEKKITICNDTIAKIKWVEAKKEEERKREYKINIAYTVVAVVLAIAIGVFIYGAWPNIQYRRAVKLYNTGSYSEAIEALNKISGESFSEQQITNADNMKQIVEIYYDAVNYYIDKNYKAAYSEFLKVKDFRNSTSGFLEPAYQEATKLWNDGDLEKAYSIFIDLGKYKDSAENALKIKSDMQR